MGFGAVKMENQRRIYLNGLKGKKVTILIRQTESPSDTIDGVLTGISEDFSHVFYRDEPKSLIEHNSPIMGNFHAVQRIMTEDGIIIYDNRAAQFYYNAAHKCVEQKKALELREKGVWNL